MKFKKMMIPGVLAGGLLVLAACGLEEPSDLDASEGWADMTVIDAVQLGAAQSCHDIAGSVTGNVAISKISDGDGLVLLSEDGYPLCIDSMQNVAEELAHIEASYVEQIGASQQLDGTPEDLEMMMNTGPTITGDPDDRETDPNPQPAVETGVQVKNFQFTVEPDPPQPSNPTPDNPPDNPSDPE